MGASLRKRRNPVVIDQLEVQVSAEEVLRQLGMPEGAEAKRALREKAEGLIGEALELAQPRGTYAIVEGPPGKGFEWFAGTEGLALGLATIGGAVERRAGELVKERRTADGAVMDAAGTIAAEHAADGVEERIRREAGKLGWKVSRRYAPGFCEWPLTGQKDVLGSFSDTLGIALSPGGLMRPEKSLSLACALAKDGDFGRIRLGKCGRCEQKGCPYRTGGRMA